MIHTLRLGTRVTTTNPVWPHIRKYAIDGTHFRYVFTNRRAGAIRVEVLTGPAGLPAALLYPDQPGAPGLTVVEVRAIERHIDADLAAGRDTSNPDT